MQLLLAASAALLAGACVSHEWWLIQAPRPPLPIAAAGRPGGLAARVAARAAALVEAEPDAVYRVAVVDAGGHPVEAQVSLLAMSEPEEDTPPRCGEVVVWQRDSDGTSSSGRLSRRAEEPDNRAPAAEPCALAVEADGFVGVRVIGTSLALARQAEGIVVEIARLPRLRGRLWRGSEPVGGAGVRWRRVDPQPRAESGEDEIDVEQVHITSETGEFALDGVTPGTYDLWCLDGEELAAARVTLRPGEVRDIDLGFDATAARQIEGQLVDRRGRAIAGALVQLSGPLTPLSPLMATVSDQANREVRTGWEGRFSVVLIGDARRTVRVFGQEALGPPALEREIDLHLPPAADGLPQLTLTVDDGAVVDCRFVDREGRPLLASSYRVSSTHDAECAAAPEPRRFACAAAAASSLFGGGRSDAVESLALLWSPASTGLLVGLGNATGSGIVLVKGPGRCTVPLTHLRAAAGGGATASAPPSGGAVDADLEDPDENSP